MEPLLKDLWPRPVHEDLQRQRAMWAGQRVPPLQPAALRGWHHQTHQGSSSVYYLWQSNKNCMRKTDLTSFLFSSSLSQERNVWTSTGKICLPTSLSLAALARSSTGPNTAASAQTSAAASPTSPRPSTWSSSALMGQGSPGRWCGSRPVSATSAAKTPTTSSLIWRVTMVTQRSWTREVTRQSCSLPWGASWLSSDFFYLCNVLYLLCDYVQGIFLWSFFLLEKSVNMEYIYMCLQNGFIKHDVFFKNIWKSASQMKIFSQWVCEIWKA